MKTASEILSAITFAIQEVASPLAKVPPDFGLRVARHLQGTPFNYSTSTSTQGPDEFIIFLDDFKQKDWMVTIKIQGDFQYTLDGPHEVGRDIPDTEELKAPEGPIVPGEPEITVAQAMARIRAAIASDEGYAWGWQSNLAMPILDDLGVNHKLANRAGARLLQHLFGYDITKQKEYTDIQNRVETTTVEDDVADSMLHITVTGYKANSGAEELSRRLAEYLKMGGYEALINIADTTLAGEERSVALPPEGVRIHVTGVESRWHSDRVAEPEDVDIPCGEGDDFGGDDPLDSADSDGPWEVESGAFESQPKLTLHVTIPKYECNPTQIIDALRDQYPDADISAKIKLDNFGCDSIKANAALKKAVRFTIHPDDPNPAATIGYLQNEFRKAYGLEPVIPTVAEHRIGYVEPMVTDSGEDTVESTIQPTLTMVKEKMMLSNPEDRANAYLFERREGDTYRNVLFHVDVDAEGFDVEQITGEGWGIVEASPGVFNTLLEKVSPEVVRYSLDLYENNARWLNRFGDGKEIATRTHEGPFTLYTIGQGAIPKAIYGEVEECWTAFQNIDRLQELSEELRDPSIVIGAEDYLKITHGGCMTVREHPRLEELFLKYIHYKATFNPLIDRWIKSFGL
jgi:hypothetical protein